MMSLNESDFEKHIIKPQEYYMTPRHDWLHFYQMSFVKQDSAYPKILTKGYGCYVWDDKGKRYFDSISGAFCVNLGYGRQDLVSEVLHHNSALLHYISPFSAAHPLSIKLAKELSDSLESVFQEESQVFFTNSGSEAVETALKIAIILGKKTHKEKTFILSFLNSYHGTTFGASSVSGELECREQTGSLYKDVIFAPAICTGNHTLCSAENCIHFQSFLNKLDIAPENLAAAIIEPLENCAGNYPVPSCYMSSLAKFCRSHDIILIVDEVITGFGRLGLQWGMESFEVIPDIVVCAKGLTSGYESLGATAVRKQIANYFHGDDDRMFKHGATFGGRPSACAIASKVIEINRQEHIFKNVEELSSFIEIYLHNLVKSSHIISHVSGQGFLWSIHIKNFDESRDSSSLYQLITENLCELGVLPSMYQTRKASFLEFAPPLIATEQELKETLDTYKKVIKQVTEYVE